MLPSVVRLLPEAAERTGISGDLTVGRIWPRGPGRLSLELSGPAGELLAGQMIDDDGDRRRLTRATLRSARRCEHVWQAPAVDQRGEASGTVLVQAHGADRRLISLPGLLAEPGSRLLVHRPERRAVLSLPQGPAVVDGGGRTRGVSGAASAPGTGESAYVRVFRPGRTAAVVRAAEAGLHLLDGLPGFAAPTVLAHQEDHGVVVTSELPGASLRDLLGLETAPRGDADVGALPAAAHAGAAGIGQLLRHLARVPAPGGLPVRDAAAELAWVEVWLDRVRRYLPEVHERLVPVLDSAAGHLRGTAPTSPGVVHGDLHDGQLLIGEDGQVGVLDWDTVALGEVALDAASVWAHTDLRRLLGHWHTEHATALWAAVVGQWDPADAELDRAGAYRRLLLVRLACQYAFRPAYAYVVGDLAALAAAQ